MEQVHDTISAFLAAPPYSACLLLVHPEIRRLERIAESLVALHKWPRLPVGRQISFDLMPESPARWPQQAAQHMHEVLGDLAPGPVLCTEIGLLFEPALGLDPLVLLRQISRTTCLIVAWPGTYVTDILTYAVPEHCRYRVWARPDVPVLAVE